MRFARRPKPIVLVLTSYWEAIWNIKLAPGARIKHVIVGSPFPQEVEGVPTGVPVHYFCPDHTTLFFEGKQQPPREPQGFYAYEGNTLNYRRMLEKLNDLTGLLVSTFQGEYTGTSFIVDGTRGREYAQIERQVRPAPPKEVKPEELLAASANAGLHVVGVYGAGPINSGRPVDVEVRATASPVVLALASYGSVLWNVKLAQGAKVSAVIVGGYFEQEIQGVPAGIPVVIKSYAQSPDRDYFFGYNWNSDECRNLIGKLNDMTGRLVSTFQGQETGVSFVVDGERGRNFAQTVRMPASSRALQPRKNGCSRRKTCCPTWRIFPPRS